MLFAILTFIIAYRRAKETGRSPILWGAIGAGVYIGTQLVVGLGLGILLGFGIGAFGWSESAVLAYELPLNIVAIVFAFTTTWLVLRYLNTPLTPEATFDQPPPPPTFSSSSE